MAAKYFLAVLVALAAVQVIYGHPGFMDDLMNKAKEIGNDIKEKAEEIGKDVKEKIDAAKDKAKDMWGSLTGKMENAWDELKKKIQDMLSNAEKQISAIDTQNMGDNIQQCVAKARDGLSQLRNDVEPKVQACIDQAQTDMKPIVDDMKNQVSKLAPEVRDEITKCMQGEQFTDCLSHLSGVASDMKTIFGNVIGDATQMPAEIMKAKDCLSAIVNDVADKTQKLAKDAVDCVTSPSA